MTGWRDGSRGARRNGRRKRGKADVGDPFADAASQAYAAGLRIDFPETGRLAEIWCPDCRAALTFPTAPEWAALTAEYLGWFVKRHRDHASGRKET